MLEYRASEGEFYIGGFVLHRLNKCQQYKTAYIELAFVRPNAAAFLVFNYFLTCPFFIARLWGPPGPERTTNIYIYMYIEREREREREKVTVDSVTQQFQPCSARTGA